MISANIYTEAISVIYSTVALVAAIEVWVIARAARREANAARDFARIAIDQAMDAVKRANGVEIRATIAKQMLDNTVTVAKSATNASVDAQAAADASKNHSIAAKDYAKQTHELMGKAVQATQPIAQGHAVCSVCKHDVARFTVTPTKGAVCANCDKE